MDFALIIIPKLLSCAIYPYKLLLTHIYIYIHTRVNQKVICIES